MKNLIYVQYERAKAVLRKNKKGLTQLAEILLEKEVIFSDDLEKIFGKRPWVRHDELPKKKEELPKKKVKQAKDPKPKAQAKDPKPKAQAKDPKPEVQAKNTAEKAEKKDNNESKEA